MAQVFLLLCEMLTVNITDEWSDYRSEQESTVKFTLSSFLIVALICTGEKGLFILFTIGKHSDLNSLILPTALSAILNC